MSKLSVHLTDPGNRKGYGDFLRIPYQARNPVSLVYQLNANTKNDVLTYSPSTLLAYRRQTPVWNRLPEDFWKGDPRVNCDNWMLNKTELGKNLIAYWRMNIADYYDPLNEPVPSSIEDAKWLNAWTIRALEIANQNGFKLFLFSFPTGTPDYSYWQYLYGALRLGKQSGAVLSLHQYGVSESLITRTSTGALSTNTIHNSLRHRNIYEILPEDCRLPLVISESACGNGYAVPLRGDAFINDAIEYDKEIMKDSYVVSANLFQLGGSESNLQEVLGKLTDYIAKTPNTTPEEPPPTDDMNKLPYIVTAYLAPQNATADLMIQVQKDAFATKSTVCQSADDARCLVRLGLVGSKVIIYDPESWPGGTEGILEFFTGCLTELRHTQSTPLKLRSPILNIPYRITSHFNDSRDYANGKHEGLDLDCFDDDIGMPVNVYASLDGIVENVVTKWTGVGYGIYVVVKHDWYGQVYKTWYCHLSSTSVTIGQSVKMGDKLGVGGSTGTTATHLHFMVQMIPGGLDGYYTPYVIDPEPLITVSNLLTQSGVGLANQNLLTSTEINAIKVSGVTRTLALTLPDYDMTKKLVEQLRSCGQDVYGRLFLSVNVGSKFTPQNFLDFCGNGLKGLYDSGVRTFQIHNEPNIQSEGYGWNWANGNEFGLWLKEVILNLRGRYPDIRLIYPGLSPQSNAVQFFKDSKFAADLCDYVGAHSYWYNESGGTWNMVDTSGGMSWKDIANLTSKFIFITEYSNNNPLESYAVKGAQYKKYLKLLNEDGRVVTAFCFALSWLGQDVNREGWVYNGIMTAIPENMR